MEENKVMEAINEVSFGETTDVAVPEVTDVAIPEGVITEVPTIDDSTSTIGIGKVIFGVGVAVAAVYGAVKGTKALIDCGKKKFGNKDKKYAKIRDDEAEVNEDDDIFEDETLGAEVTDESVNDEETEG